MEDVEAGASRLHINNVQPEDVGRYMCQVGKEVSPYVLQIGKKKSHTLKIKPVDHFEPFLVL